MVFRGLVAFAVIAAVSVGAAWLAQNPGEVAIAWRGWRVDTSFAALALATGVLVVAAALLYRFWRTLVDTPRALARMRRERRRRKGAEALTRGLVAVASGDPEEARRQVRAANAQLGQPPLALLLAAQAAQLEGKESVARECFAAMLERPETEFLGLRGMLTQAERAGDREAALGLVRRAHRLRPRTGWVLTSLFEKEAAAGNWAAAERALGDAVRHRALPEAESRRIRAAVLLQQAFAADTAGDGSAAARFVRKALEADPGFRPAAVEQADRLLAGGKHRAALKLVERAWAEAPHPTLARVYGEAVRAKDAIRRFQAIEKLAAINPGHLESCLAQARAALEAKLWGEARRCLAEISEGPARSARYCRLMAEIEEAENGDTVELRQWLARAAEAPPDPGWACGRCGAQGEDWHAICGNCGAFGEIDWRVPPRAAPVPAPPDGGAVAPASAAGTGEIAPPLPRAAVPVRQ